MRKKVLASVVVVVLVLLAAWPAGAGTPGTIKWTFKTGGDVSSSPALGPDGTIYFGCFDGKLYALKPDGTKKHEFPMGIIGRSSFLVTPEPFIDGSPIVIGGGYGGIIHGFDPKGLVPKWSFDTGYPIYSTPVLGYRTIYVPVYTMKWGKYYPGQVYALSVPDGTLKWKFQTAGQIISSPAVGKDGTIYMGVYSNDTNFYAINPNCTKKWTFPLGGTSYSPALGPDGTIYIAGYAINPDGTQKWKNTWVDGEMVVGPDGTIYAGKMGGGLIALNPGDGSEKWTFTGGKPTSAPAVGGDGTIYFGGWHNVFAVKPDGSQKWVCPCPTGSTTGYSAPVLSLDGTIYIGLIKDGETGTGRFLAIYGNSPGLARTNWPMFLRDAKHTGSLMPRGSTPIGAFLELLLWN